MQYLTVKNWEKHQHYSNRKPPWIKLYNDLAEDYEFTFLSDASKLQLILIWLLASRTNNHIPMDARWIKKAIGVDAEVNLEVLVDLGFLVVEENLSDVNPIKSTMGQDASTVLAPCEPDASTVLAPCEQDASTVLERVRDREREEKEPPLPPKGGAPDGAVAFPIQLDNEDFRKAWAEFEAYRRERKIKKLLPRSVNAQFSEMASWGSTDAISAIHYTIKQGYQGIVRPKSNGFANKPYSALKAGEWDNVKSEDVYQTPSNFTKEEIDEACNGQLPF